MVNSSERHPVITGIFMLLNKHGGVISFSPVPPVEVEEGDATPNTFVVVLASPSPLTSSSMTKRKAMKEEEEQEERNCEKDVICVVPMTTKLTL